MTRPDDSIMHIEVSGTKYSLDLAEFTPRDARDFRGITGTRLVDAIAAPDLDHVAAFVWLHRRRMEPKLSLADVEDGFTLGSVDMRPDASVVSAPEVDDPEA